MTRSELIRVCVMLLSLTATGCTLDNSNAAPSTSSPSTSSKSDSASNSDASSSTSDSSSKKSGSAVDLTNYKANGSFRIDKDGLHFEGTDNEGNAAQFDANGNSTGTDGRGEFKGRFKSEGSEDLNIDIKSKTTETTSISDSGAHGSSDNGDGKTRDGKSSRVVKSDVDIVVNGEHTRRESTYTFNVINDENSGTLKGSGHLQSEPREIPPFSKLESTGAVKLRFNCGSERHLLIEADDNILPVIKTAVTGDTLKIWSSRSYSSEQPIVVNVSNPQLDSIASSGSGNLDVRNVDEQGLDVDISGSSNMTVTGQAKDLDLSISGSGSFDGAQLRADTAKVNVRGSGSAEVNVDKRIDASISGSGSVKYSGHAQVNSHVTGSGQITQL